MNNDHKDAYTLGTGSSSQSSNGNGGDVRNSMASFRSDPSQVDNANAGGTGSRAEPYTPHPIEIILSSLIPPTGTSGQRPRGLLSTRSMAGGAGSQYYGDYDDECNAESSPSYFRRAGGQSPYGLSASSLVGFQLLMGQGMGFQMFPQRRSPMTPGLAVSLLQMLTGVCGPDCPYHGSERHQHGSENDGYSGPIITEVSDDEGSSGSGEMLALTSSGTPNESGINKNKNANSEKKVKINKNATIRRNVTPIAEGTTPVIGECEDEGLHGNDWMNQVENVTRQGQQKGQAHDPVMHTMKMKTVLRRRNLGPYDLDNRQHYEHDEPSTHHGDISVPTETSNVWKFACDVYAVPPSCKSQTIEILESPLKTEGVDDSQDDVLYDPNMRKNSGASDPNKDTDTYYIVDSEGENDDGGDALFAIEAEPEGHNVIPHKLDISLQEVDEESTTEVSIDYDPPARHDGKVDATAEQNPIRMDHPVTSFSTGMNDQPLERHNRDTVHPGTGINDIFRTGRPGKTNKGFLYGIIKGQITDNVVPHEQGVGQTGPNAEAHNRINYDEDTVHTFQQVKKGLTPRSLKERSDTPDALDAANRVVNPLNESLSFDQKRTEQHTISPNNTLAKSYPGRTSAQGRNINTFPIHPAGFDEQKADSPFQQMVKDHLPRDVPGSQYGDVRGNFRAEDIRTNPISQMFQSQAGTNLHSTTTMSRQHSKESYQDSLNAFAYGTNNAAKYMQNSIAQNTSLRDDDTYPSLPALRYPHVDSKAEVHGNLERNTGGHNTHTYLRQCDCGSIDVCCDGCDKTIRTVSSCECDVCMKNLVSVLNNQNQQHSVPVHHHDGSHSPGHKNGHGQNPGLHLHQARSYSSDTAAHGSSGLNDPLKEQHLLGDTALHHQELEPVNTTPKKPARNKNLVMRRTTFSEKKYTSSANTGTHISSPNFTSSSYQRNHGASTATSDYQSNYDDNYYQRSPSTDRLSSLSDHMIKEGMVVKDVYPDGNCFFAAVVDQLRIRGEFYYTAKSLRKAAVKYLREHPKQADGTPLLEFVSDHENMSWEEYLLRQNRDGEWADHIIISAITNVLKRRLVIHSVRRGDHKVNKTTMEPELTSLPLDTHLTSTETSGADQSTEQKFNNVFDGDSRGAEADDRFHDGSGVLNNDDEWFDDLMLGHIPEAHYVSLRYADWEERLFETLKSRKGESENHLTTYGHRRSSRDSYDSAKDSNEDLADHMSVQLFYELPYAHFNFLFTYLKNGQFIERYSYYNFSRPEFPEGLFTSWIVGDIPSCLEAYLVTDSPETIRAKYKFDQHIEPVVGFVAFPHDIVVSRDYTNEPFRKKQLLPDETGCKLGYLKLQPVTPEIWDNQLIQIDGKLYLKHLYYITNPDSDIPVPIHVSFKSEWPEDALACKERMVKFNLRLPQTANDWIKQEKVVDGVRVVPVCADDKSCYDPNCLEWKYSFSAIEYVIAMNIITSDARFCYHIMDHFLRFVFQGRNVITKVHAKAVFFYTCADLDIGNNEPSFLQIVSHFMLLLERSLRDEFLPDFFMRSINLVEDVSSQDIAWHYEKAHVARDQYLIYMFLFLDQKGLMDHFKLSKCLDSLLFDAQKSNQNHSHCFARLTVMEAREWIMISHYYKAKRLITDLVTEESNDEDEEEEERDQKREYELHKRVLVGLPLQEKWLYAFYMEYYTGQPLLSHVCDEHDCTKLKDVFGENLIETIMSVEGTQLQSRAIRLPSNIAQQEGIACFAVRFSSLLRMQMYFTSAFAAGIHFFLASHTDLLLTTYSSDDSASYPKMTDSLFTLYRELYNHYKHNGILQQFSSLMEPYTRLCDFQPSISNYEWLSDLLHYFGDSEKASVAAMKADSMRHDQYTKETRL